MDVPVSVWEQIPVIIVFTLLLVFVGKILINQFTKTIEKMETLHATMVDKLNDHYLQLIEVYDKRWQEQVRQVNNTNQSIIEKLKVLSDVIHSMNEDVKEIENHIKKE